MAFSFYYIFHAVAANTSRWMPKSARWLTLEKTDTDTPNDYCNPRCACALRVNYAENIHSIIILGDNNYCLL